MNSIDKLIEKKDELLSTDDFKVYLKLDQFPKALEGDMNRVANLVWELMDEVVRLRKKNKVRR